MSNIAMFVTKRNGTQEVVKFDNITNRIKKLMDHDENEKINSILITQKVIATIYPGINTIELDLQSAEICVNMSTLHPFYSNLAGRILVSNLHKTTSSSILNVVSSLTGVKEMSDQEHSSLISQINQSESEYDSEVKKQSRNKMIRIAVLAMAIVALFMALQ